MELLLSGALVYSLLKLPGVLDQWMLSALPHVSAAFQSVVVLTTVYLRAGLVALSAAFVLHLCLRSWWVALVGVHSVFPSGPRWERIRQGPLTMARMRSLCRPMPQRIEQMDNAASVVYATGLSMGLLMLSLALGAGVMVLISALLAHWQVFKLGHNQWFMLIAGTLLIPQLLASLIDLWLGRQPQGAHAGLRRFVRPLIAMQSVFPGINTASLLINTLLSNLVRRGAVAVGMIIMLVAIVVSSLAMPQAFDRLRPTIVVPNEAGALSGRSEYYRDQRTGLNRLSLSPSLASQELRDAPLRLFLPMRRDRHPAVLRTQCPELAQSTGPRDDAQIESQLACLHRWSRPLLDGQALPQHDLIYNIDPQSGQEGVLWRVPNALITPGRHVLSLHVRDPDTSSTDVAAPLQIVFFK
jgi:hypothetical protein